MAPIKFDESIKDKLERRTLEPSPEAWNTLSDKLEADSHKPSKRTFLWLGVAASLVGVFLVVNMFFKTTETKQQQPVVVDTEIHEIETIQSTEKVDIKKPIVHPEETSIATTQISKKDTTLNIHTEQTPIATSHQNNMNGIAKVKQNKEPEKVLNNPIQEPLLSEAAIVQSETQKNENRTETDIDALLLKAQQKLKHNTTQKVYAIDAKALLQDVEADLDESFRAKVFETLITGYKKVKTAVAERNN